MARNKKKSATASRSRKSTSRKRSTSKPRGRQHFSEISASKKSASAKKTTRRGAASSRSKSTSARRSVQAPARELLSDIGNIATGSSRSKSPTRVIMKDLAKVGRQLRKSVKRAL